jgi:hypothetical protein
VISVPTLAEHKFSHLRDECLVGAHLDENKAALCMAIGTRPPLIVIRVYYAIHLV